MVRLLIVLLLVIPGSTAALPRADDDPWPVVPGWASLSRLEENPDDLYVLRWYDGSTTEIAGREVMVLSGEYYGNSLNRLALFYSRNEEGDLFYHGSLDPDEGTANIFEPPVLYLDLPLEAGKSWEVDSRRYDNLELEGAGVAERGTRRVEGPERIRTPGGMVDAWKISTEVDAGDGMGTDWFAPGVGMVRFTFGQDGPLARQEAWTLEGPLALPGIGDVVSLDFGWRPGLKVRVKKYALKVKDSQTGPDTTGAVIEYTLEVNRTPMGMLVHMADLDLGLPDSLTETNETRAAQEVMDRTSKALPDFLVSRDGLFTGLSGAAASLDSTFSLVSSLLAESADDPEIVADVMKTMREVFTPEVYESFAADEWNKLIGTWLDFSAETGVIYEGEFSVPSPIFAGLEVPMFFLVAIAEPCGCNEASTRDDCVRLIYSSKTDGEALEDALAGLVEKLSRERLTGVRIENLTISTDIMSIMEPGTMRLHEVHYVKRVNLDATGPDGEKEPGRQVEREDYFFTYPQ